MGRPALSEISKYIPSSRLSRYYGPHSGFDIVPQMNILKTSDSIISLPQNQYVTNSTPHTASVPKPNNDLVQFIEKQEGYIEQLERESEFCRV